MSPGEAEIYENVSKKRQMEQSLKRVSDASLEFAHVSVFVVQNLDLFKVLSTSTSFKPNIFPCKDVKEAVSHLQECLNLKNEDELEAAFQSGYQDLISEGVLQKSIWRKIFPNEESIISQFGPEELQEILSGKSLNIQQKVNFFIMMSKTKDVQARKSWKRVSVFPETLLR